jgi:hypothetical protein
VAVVESQVSVVTRDIATLTLVQDVPVIDTATGYVGTIACLDPAARRWAALVTLTESSARLIIAHEDGIETVWEGEALAATIQKETAWLSAGPRGHQLVRVDLDSGEAEVISEIATVWWCSIDSQRPSPIGPAGTSAMSTYTTEGWPPPPGDY